MSTTTPTLDIQSRFESTILEAWHSAHGEDQAYISSNWGEDRIVVMIENVLSQAERMLVRTQVGSETIQKYIHELFEDAVRDRQGHLSQIIQQEIPSFSISVDTATRLIILVFAIDA